MTIYEKVLRLHFAFIRLGVVLATILLSSCVVTSESKTEYFLLNSTAVSTDAVNLDSFTLGVGPIELAEYLNQSGIAIHLASNQVEYAESKRWAEPLDSNISQVLLANITTLLPNQIVYPFPWKTSQSPDYKIRVNIIRFGWFPESKVSLNARITIENKRNEIVLSSVKTVEKIVAAQGYQENVVAQNAVLEEFGRLLVQLLSEII